jgi:hypothetical protein
MPLKLVEIKNLQKQPVPEDRRSSYDDITTWETDGRKNINDFPQQLIQDVRDSPTGASALDIWEEFTAGNGFVSEELNHIIVNREKETLEELLEKVAADVVRFYGFAIHVSYNAKGQISELHHQPFEQTRLGKISKTGKVHDIKCNPYFGIRQDYDQKYTKKYYTFNPDPEHVIKEIHTHIKDPESSYAYPGQVFWVSIEKPLSRVYPIPFYYSAINWFRIDSEIQKFHERNLKNNMLLGHIINVVGDPEAAVGELDEDGNPRSTVGAEFDKMLQKHANGAEVGGGQWVNWGASKDDFAEIIPFPNNINDNTFTQLQEQTNSQISIGTNVPPILLNIQTSGKLGETKEILNAIKMMQGRVKRLQAFLSKNIKKVVTLMNPATATMDFRIRDINIINVLPEWSFDAMTTEEKRKYLQDNFPVELSIAEETIRPDSGGDQSIAGIKAKDLNQILKVVEKYNTGQLTRDQAAQVLMTRFAMAEDQVATWLGEDEVEVEIDARNESFTDYPEGATSNAKKALEWAEKNGWGDCGTGVGKERANQLAKREPISKETIKRTRSFLARSEQHKDVPYSEGCGGLMYDAWGGDAMKRYVDSERFD